MLNAALASLPLGTTPAALGRQIEQSARERLAGDGRSETLTTAGQSADGCRRPSAAGVTNRLCGMDSAKGFCPTAFPNELAAAATATANPPTPVQVTIRGTVLVIQTATATPMLLMGHTRTADRYACAAEPYVRRNATGIPVYQDPAHSKHR